MITVYTITYNEELLIQFMIDHYRQRFPGCRIVVYDNISTDNTVKIALDNRCEVIPYNTGGQIQDSRYIEIKNNCWKDAKTNWVLICDLDELLEINANQLKTEEKSGTTIVRSTFYTMVNLKNNRDLAGIKYGVKNEGAGKCLLFNKKLIKEINYGPGCHACRPVGTAKYSRKTYKLYHYNFIDENLTIKKYKTYAKRLSPQNLKNGWGTQYLLSAEEIHQEYADDRKNALKIR